MVRNELAHEGVLVPRAEAIRFIEAIENELKAWSILT